MNSEWRSILGSSLLSVGLLFGLCCAASSVLGSIGLPQGMIIPPIYYAIAIFLMLLGLYIIRSRRLPGLLSHSAHERPPSPDSLLSDLLTQLIHIGHDLHHLHAPELSQRIGQLTSSYILPSLAAREALFSQLSRQQAVFVLLSLTHGHKILDRLLADVLRGSLEDAQQSYQEALGAFRKAHAQFS